jgi:hypothetical protein
MASQAGARVPEARRAPELLARRSPFRASGEFEGLTPGIEGLTSLKENRSSVMGFREERIAKNEAVVREINESVQQAHASAPRSSFMHIVCECGYEECDSIIALTKDEYERIRNDPRQFCVIEKHVIQDVEIVVEDNDRFAIVAKRQGTPAEVAIRTDPRG